MTQRRFDQGVMWSRDDSRAGRRASRVGWAVAVLTSVVLAACGGGSSGEENASPDAAEPATVRMATSGVTLLWVHLWAAEEFGFFEDEGIDAEIVETPSGVTGTQALLTGDVDVSSAPLGHVIDAVREQGRDVRAVAALVNENANTLVVSTEWADAHGITEDSSLEDKIAGLRGARVGVVGPGSAVDDFARFVLQTHGLDPDRDVEMVGIGSSTGMAPALSAGEIDAFVAGSPAAETPIVRGEAIPLVRGPVGDVPELAGQLFVVATVAQEMIDERPEVVQAVVNGLYRTELFIAQNPDEVRDFLRGERFADLDEEVWQLAWENTLPSYAADPTIAQDGYQVNFDVLEVARGRDEAEPVDLEQIVDPTFADKALDEVTGP